MRPIEDITLYTQFNQAQAELERFALLQDISTNRSLMASRILSFARGACNSDWMICYSDKYPKTVINFLNQLNEISSDDAVSYFVKRIILASPTYKFLKESYPNSVDSFLNVKPITAHQARSDFLLELFQSCSSKPIPDAQTSFSVATHSQTRVPGDFQTFKQIWDVKDELKRILIARTLIANNFNTRKSAIDLGLSSDGTLASNVRVLFGASDFKRATIEPLIRGWLSTKPSLFEHVISALSSLNTLSEIEQKLDYIFSALIKKATVDCQFVKSRITSQLGTNEHTLRDYIERLSLSDWYNEAHKSFLEKKCAIFDYNLSKVATILGVDVRYVTKYTKLYGIEKPNEPQFPANRLA